MGRKQTKAGKQVYFCTSVLLILLITVGCHSLGTSNKAYVQKKDDQEIYLAYGKKLFGEGDFSGALREFEKACSPVAKSPFTEEALFYLGSIHSDPANPKRDSGKAVVYFKKVVDNHPKSVFSEQSRIMLAILKENDDSNRTIERLRAIIEAAKKVDREIEEKRREKTGK